jgi:hypothetical protein
VKVTILGDPTADETLAIVAALKRAFRNVPAPRRQLTLSKWRKAARSLDREFDPC